MAALLAAAAEALEARKALRGALRLALAAWRSALGLDCNEEKKCNNFKGSQEAPRLGHPHFPIEG